MTFERLTREQYNALPGERWSLLKEIVASSPLHYRHRKRNPKPSTKPQKFGTATHCATLEPDEFPLRYVLDPADYDRRTKSGKEVYASLLAAAGNRELLDGDDYRRCLAIRDAVRTHPVAGAHLRSGRAEAAVTWTDAETGIACKALADWIGDLPVLDDLKTAADIDEFGFGYSAGRYLYHGQIAFYLDGLRANGIDCGGWLIAAESDPPHDVACFEVCDEQLDAGRAAVRLALRTLADCQDRDEWPGRYPAAQKLWLPKRFVEDDGPAFEIIQGGAR